LFAVFDVFDVSIGKSHTLSAAYRDQETARLVMTATTRMWRLAAIIRLMIIRKVDYESRGLRAIVGFGPWQASFFRVENRLFFRRIWTRPADLFALTVPCP
jgi:hypothetical protein